jgi:hypothetical protein
MMSYIRVVCIGFGVVCGLSGCSRPHKTPPAAPTLAQNTIDGNAAPSAPSAPRYVYAPLRAYLYDRSIPPAADVTVYEGRSPETDAEWRQAVAANPDSSMAKAQETFRRADGQMMWRYTQTTPIEPQIEVRGVDFSKHQNGSFSGQVTLRNLTGFSIMDIQIVMQTNHGNIVLIPPTYAAQPLIAKGQGQVYSFQGSVNPAVGPITAASLRVEAQVNGPPGLVTSDTPLGVSQVRTFSGQ